MSEILESCKQATMYKLSQLTICNVHTGQQTTISTAQWCLDNLTNEIDFQERIQDGEKTTQENDEKLHWHQPVFWAILAIATQKRWNLNETSIIEL